MLYIAAECTCRLLYNIHAEIAILANILIPNTSV